MRRVGRYIYGVLTMLSLLICLATGVLWARADHNADMLVYNSTEAGALLIASPAGIQYVRYPHGLINPGEWAEDISLHWWKRWHRERHWWGNNVSGFTYQQGSQIENFTVGLPHWFICLITALAPGIWLTARLRRQRIPPGHCPKCRYDLRATPDRCPECGHVPQGAGKKRCSATENTEDTEKDEEAIATDEDR